jgi:N-acetylmuramoyl-L-alanine amidase
MRIAISSGHSTKCQGAIGYLNEVEEATRVVDRVHEIWQDNGVESVKFHDTVSDDSSENLNRIVNWHDAQQRDLDVSVHFNAGGGTGSEVLWVTQEDLAADVSEAMASAANWTNRGPKYRSDLFFLNSTDKPAILLEVCFVDSQSDSNKWRDDEVFEAVCQAIAESIVGRELGDGDGGGDGDRPELPERPERPPAQEQTVVDVSIFAPEGVRVDVSINGKPAK